MTKRDDRRHKYAIMISAHRDEWTRFNKKQFDKPIKADMTAIRKIWSATSSPKEAVKRIKSYFKSDAKAGWMSAFKTAWVETGNATIVYMHEFLTAKSAYVDGFYDPYSYTPSYFYGKVYNLQLKQDVAETQDVWSQQVNERITGDAFHDKIVGINETTESKIHNTIADGVAEGKGHYEIGQDVESKLDETWPGRGMTISRTEANSAMNQATREDMKATVPDLWKTWSTTGMDNVRDWHAEVDGESIPQEEMFIVDGEEMNGPGDDSASSENIINCACCLLAEEPQAGTPLSDEEQARVDAEAIAAEVPTSSEEVPTGEVRAEAETLYKNAVEREGETNNMVTTIADLTNGKLENLEFSLKSEDSTARKIAGYLKDNPNLTANEAAQNVTDSLRYTIIYDDTNFTDNIIESQKMLDSEGYKPLKMKNYFGSNQEGGYQGYNTVWTDKQGNNVELQYHTEESLRIKEDTHLIYQKARVETDPDEITRMIQEMDGKWNDFTPPTNYNALPAMK